MKKFRKMIAILFIVFVAALTLILLLKPQSEHALLILINIEQLVDKTHQAVCTPPHIADGLTDG